MNIQFLIKQKKMIYYGIILKNLTNMFLANIRVYISFNIFDTVKNYNTLI